MSDSMRKYMRTGLIHFMAYPEVMKGEGPILETLRAILRDDYFDAVEVTWMKDDAVREQARDMLRTSHISIAYGAQPRLLTTGLNINDLDQAGRRAAVATLKEGIDEAVYLGAEGFAFLSGKYPEDRLEEAFAALLASTRELCDYAWEKGCPRVTLEVFDYDVDKASLIGPAPLAKRFAEEMARTHENFGLLVDLSHLPLLRETPEEAILPVLDHLVHAHMGNCVVRMPGLPAYGDAHPRFGFPDGENDVEELADYLRVLLGAGFLNTENPPILSFEVKPFGTEEPELVIANAKRTLNRAWSLVNLQAPESHPMGKPGPEQAEVPVPESSLSETACGTHAQIPKVDYSRLEMELGSLIEGESDWIANCANASALLFQHLSQLNWVGFYLMKEDQLVLGPFQGNPACIRIPLGKGVCGTAAAETRTLVVPDVHRFPGHIACDAASASEIVIPLVKEGQVIGVLDIDSPIPDRFSEVDRVGLEAFARKLLQGA